MARQGDYWIGVGSNRLNGELCAWSRITAQRIKPMTSKSVTVPVLNSLLFIRDKNIRSLPEIDGHSSVWSTPSCVAVSCLPDSDGETRVIIGSAEDVRRDGDPLFDARLMTPSGHVIVENVLGERILGDWGTETRYAGDGVDERFS